MLIFLPQCHQAEGTQIIARRVPIHQDSALAVGGIDARHERFVLSRIATSMELSSVYTIRRRTF
jgi:hypothetical protein